MKMTTTKRLGITDTRVFALVVFLGCCFLFPAGLNAQNYQGYNAVWGYPALGSIPACDGSGSTATPVVCQSSALIDASVIGGSDFCAAVHNALVEALTTNALPGAVIDARGIATPASCGSNPWSGISMPSTVLLPAGAITVSTSWVLPSGTKIIGEGVGMTTLAATSGVTTLISFCRAACTGVGVQDLNLTQTNANSIAIDNEFAQNQSYVRRVTIFVSTTNTVTGLQIGAPNSGPYEDITFYGSSNTALAETGPACVWVKEGASGVNVHGLNCVGNVNFSVAVLLDGSNDSIEDVSISSFYTDGILVGVDNNVSNDVMINITGGNTNTVHVCGPNGGSGACPTSYTVSDLSILGVTKSAATNSIKDEVTSTALSDATVAMYILGEGIDIPNPAYARFTTSRNTATWGVGNIAPSGNCSSSTNTKGALFSNTSGNHTTSDAFWVCTGSGGWVGVY